MNETAAPVIPAAGSVCDPFRYFQSTKVVEFAAYNPTQSVRLPGPLATVAVTVLPGATRAVLTAIVVLLATVTFALVATSVAPV